MTVFDYTDYRSFLKERYAFLKESRDNFTYTTIAEKAGFKSPGFITQIFQGKTNLSSTMIAKIGDVFELDRRERSYFTILVNYTQAVTHDEKKNQFEKMIQFPESMLAKIDPEQYEILDKWYYGAVRAVVSYFDFQGDYEKLGAMIQPSITAKKAEKAVDLLERIGSIVKDDTGRYRVEQKHITTGHGASSVPVNTFILNTMEIAKDALYQFDKPHRSFSAVTTSVSAEGYDLILAEAEAFRKRVIEITKNDRNMDRVYQVNLQVFPLTKIDDGRTS